MKLGDWPKPSYQFILKSCREILQKHKCDTCVSVNGLSTGLLTLKITFICNVFRHINAMIYCALKDEASFRLYSCWTLTLWCWPTLLVMLQLAHMFLLNNLYRGKIMEHTHRCTVVYGHIAVFWINITAVTRTLLRSPQLVCHNLSLGTHFRRKTS